MFIWGPVRRTKLTIPIDRPKVIPITEPLPPFPRLGAVVNYRSKVRGKLDYNTVPQARIIIENERKKRQESRTRVSRESRSRPLAEQNFSHAVSPPNLVLKSNQQQFSNAMVKIWPGE